MSCAKSSSQMIDFKPPITHDMLSGSWRERLGYSSEGLTDAAARDRDRDLKLLGWLEYSETLAEGEPLLGHADPSAPLPNGSRPLT